MKVSRAAVATVAACLTVGFAGVSPATAAPSKDDSASAKSAQSRTPSTRTINRRLNTTRRQVSTATRRLRRVTTNLGALTARVGRGEGGLNLLLGAAPQLVNGLTTLGNVVRDQIGPGLTTLANTVRDTIGPGLARLGAAYPANEYGRAGLFASGAATPTVAAGGSATSADIPDDGNTVTVTETAIVVAGAAGQMDLNLRAAIRSAETDGDATNETAGQAGGFLFVKNADTGVRVACAGTPNPPGIMGTQPGDSIVTPTGTVTNLSLKNIPGGLLRTDTTAPTATSTSLLPADCSFGAGLGTTYEVHYSVNFADIPTTTSPGPAD